MENQNLNNPTTGEYQAPSTMPESNPKKNFWVILGVILIIILAVFLLLPKSEQEEIKKIADDAYRPAVAIASKFATYDEVPVNISPKIPDYFVEKNLSNVTNASYFVFSDEAKKLLVKNAFMVKPSYHDEFFPIYESNRYSYTPSFITTDSILHNYHLMFDFLLKQLEEEKLAVELKQLNASMLSEALSYYKSLKGTEWENVLEKKCWIFRSWE